jgi:hypothetical protein
MCGATCGQRVSLGGDKHFQIDAPLESSPMHPHCVPSG